LLDLVSYSTVVVKLTSLKSILILLIFKGQNPYPVYINNSALLGFVLPTILAFTLGTLKSFPSKIRSKLNSAYSVIFIRLNIAFVCIWSEPWL